MARDLARQIDWGSARVRDGRLSVKLSGSSSSDWKRHFESVLALLGARNGEWGDVHLTDKHIKVADLRPGTETEVRHFLESIVVQANSDCEPDAPKREDKGEHAAADERMTTVFRGFANRSSGGESRHPAGVSNPSGSPASP